MKRNHFRTLLFLYLLLIVISGMATSQEKNEVPSDIAERADKVNYLFMDEMPFAIQVAIASVMGLTILTGLIGFVGMLFFWSKARYFFAVAVVIKILLSLAPKWSVSSSSCALVGELEILFDGIITSLIFWGNAKPLFEANRQKGEVVLFEDRSDTKINDL